MTTLAPFDFLVTPALAGERLDRAMAALAAGVSRGEARRLIAAGVVFVAGHRTGICSRRVRAGERLTWNVPAVVAPGFEEGGDRPAPRIVLERPELWIIDKPAGMPVEATRLGARGTLVEWLEGRGGGLIAHRLDVATSGVLAVARDRPALVALNALFAAHAVERRYLAVVSPATSWDVTTFDQPLDGRSAVTHARVIGRSAEAALLEITLETGRTQQIRRHLRGGGLAVVGETAEGARTQRRLLLHAYALSTEWRRGGPGTILHVVVPPPEDFTTPARALGIEIPALPPA